MKKLYRKGTVHPSPASASGSASSDQLAFLPAAILALTAALTSDDQEVLAYLLSCSSNFDPTTHNPKLSRKNISGIGADHPPMFSCNCFRCYMSYWARWDSSPNRQLIHEIIDAYEDGLVKKNPKSRRERRKQKGFNHGGLNSNGVKVNNQNNHLGVDKEDSGQETAAEDRGAHGGPGGGESGGGEEEKGSVRKFVSFIGERIWGVWGN